jgi:sucrose-6-phosphate hydrolase SacC (GH32 family)
MPESLRSYLERETASVKSYERPDVAYDIDPVEASLNQHYHQPFRPQFHYTAIQGHIGDATGLIYDQGEYHLFTMFDKWERRRNRHKCWGHAVSRDCIHWEELPPVLDTLIDHKPGSGSGLVDWNNSLGLRAGPHKTLAIFYTDYQTGTCIAYSNDAGRTWIRHPRNPVIAGADDARDPTVFWYAPATEWRMVRYEKQGFVFYGSANLLDWTQFSRIEGFYESTRSTICGLGSRCGAI